jgi:hypothetical protein
MGILFDGHKIVLVHIPKTGGGTLTSMMPKLNKMGITCHKILPNHATAAELRKRYPRHTFVTILREPLSRLQSGYRFLYGTKKTKWLRAKRILRHYRTFSGWVNVLDRVRPGRYGAPELNQYYKTMSEYVSKDGNLLVDHMFRSPTEFWAWLGGRYRRRLPPLPTSGAGAHVSDKRIATDVDDVDMEIIHRLYGRDYELWNSLL